MVGGGRPLSLPLLAKADEQTDKQTDEQTDKQTDKRRVLHNLPGGG